MPSKNAKVKGPPEKVYNFFGTEELNSREQKYTNRMMELRACLNFVDGKFYLYCCRLSIFYK